MNYSIGELLYFSPTMTTKKILESIAEGFGSNNCQHLDATYSEVTTDKTFSTAEICIIGSPVYGGRLPSTFLSRISHVNGNGRLAIIVVVYGNRDFEDALVELFDFAIAHNFKPIAFGAFIGEHSFSTSQFPLAQGRPDSADISKANDFGRKILKKLSIGHDNMDLNAESIPGNRPYKPITRIMNVAPHTDLDSCTQCQRCVLVCPVHAIQASNPTVSDGNLCIRCCACIKDCPVGARSMTEERILQISNRLFDTCKDRKEPLFIE